MVGNLAFAIWLKVYCLQISQKARLILTSFHLLKMSIFFFLFFFQYPKGLDLYYKNYAGVNKDMVHYKKNYLEYVRKKKKDPEAKYTIYGYFLALQYWAHETIDKVAQNTLLIIVARVHKC